MNGKEKIRGRKGYDNTGAPSRKGGRIVTGIVIGLAASALAVGIGYGVLFIASLYTLTTELSDRREPSKTLSFAVPEVEAPEQAETPAPPAPLPEARAIPKTVVANNPPEKHIAEKVEIPSETVQGDASEKIEETYQQDEPDEIRNRELELLRAELPYNRMIPDEKNDAEVEALLADAAEQQALQQLIDSDTATAADRERYYDLISKQYEDEIELINHCNLKVGDSGDPETAPNGLCATISRGSDERLKEIESSMEKLRQKVL